MSNWGDEGGRPRHWLLAVLILGGTALGLYLAWRSGAFGGWSIPSPRR